MWTCACGPCTRTIAVRMSVIFTLGRWYGVLLVCTACASAGRPHIPREDSAAAPNAGIAVLTSERLDSFVIPMASLVSKGCEVLLRPHRPEAAFQLGGIDRRTALA